MPDEWEMRYGLDPKDAPDNAMDEDDDGYTNIEEYLTARTRLSLWTTRSPKTTRTLWRNQMRSSAYHAMSIRMAFIVLASMAFGEPSTLMGSDKSRVIATSDGEIDAECSMVRFLLYVNATVCSGSCCRHFGPLGVRR